MKNLYILILILSINNVFSQCANSILSEGFETSTALNEPTGWKWQGVDVDQNITTMPFSPARTGVKRMGFNLISENAIVKVLYCPGTINFWWRASGASSNFKVDIEYSFDKISWTVVDNLTATGSGSPTSYIQKNIVLPNSNFIAPFNTYIRFNMSARVSGTFYMDDLCISKGTCTVVPTQLRFFEVPTNCISSNRAFGLKVCATDNNGFIDSTYSSPIIVSLATGTGLLSGTTNITAVNGCATYNDLKYSTTAPLSLAANSGLLVSTNNPIGLDIVAKCPNVDTLKLVTYNLLNFPEGGPFALGATCTPQITFQNRVDTLAKILTYLKPDMLIVQELQTEAGAISIRNRALNINGVTNYAMAPYIPNTSTIVQSYNNELYYNSNKWALKQVRIIKTGTRDCTYYIMYGKDPNLATTKDTTFIDVLSFHTKARGFIDPTGDNARKTADCKAVIDSIRSWYPGPRNIVIGGDLNFYSSVDGGFLQLTTGANKFNDPVPEIAGGTGAWEANLAYSKLHTQAARCSACLSLECGATGGLDSRLDFWLMSDPVMDGSKRIKYIDNTHNILGNDGSKFNKSINFYTSANSRIAAQPIQNQVVPQTILNSLFNMSDHLPLEVKLKITYPDLSILAIENIKLFSRWVGTEATIRWEATAYNKVQYLELQHSVSGLKGSFKPIFTTSEPNLYSQFIDKKIKPGVNYYRLKLVENNEEISYSSIISLKFDGLSYVQLSPNPVVNELIIKTYHLNIDIKSTTKIFSSMGKLIANFDIVGEGFLTKEFSINNLAKGLYFVQINQGKEIKIFKILKE
jgi:hypothetical protein